MLWRDGIGGGGVRVGHGGEEGVRGGARRVGRGTGGWGLELAGALGSNRAELILESGTAENVGGVLTRCGVDWWCSVLGLRPQK